MQKVIWRLFFNYEKEEAWLNKLSAEGLAFVGYSIFRYAFVESLPGEYTYRIELLDNIPSHPKSQNYLAFMAENGVEHISSWFRWVYFRKKAENGQFDIYSDVKSRIAHYQRISMLWFILMVSNISLGLINLGIGLEYLFGSGPSLKLSSLLVGIFAITVGIVIFLSWNSLRKKLNRLKLEKNLHE